MMISLSTVALAAVRSKVLVLLLLVHCLLLPPIFMGVLCLVLVLLASRHRGEPVFIWNSGAFPLM